MSAFEGKADLRKLGHQKLGDLFPVGGRTTGVFNKSLSQNRNFSATGLSTQRTRDRVSGTSRLQGPLSMPHELSDKCAPASPHCPACGQVMRLARITSRFGDLPDIYTFECRACGVSHIEPALSASIAGALQLGACRKDLWTLATSETYDA